MAPRRYSVNDAYKSQQRVASESSGLAAIVDSVLALETSLEKRTIMALLIAGGGVLTLVAIIKHRRRRASPPSPPARTADTHTPPPLATRKSIEIDQSDIPTPSWMSSRANVSFEEIDEPSWVSRIESPSPLRRPPRAPTPMPVRQSVAVSFDEPVRTDKHAAGSRGRYFCIRLRPKTDFKAALEHLIAAHHLKAAAIVTCVGSLTDCVFRLALAKSDAPAPVRTCAVGEIVSLTGTLSTHGSHVHIALGDKHGDVVGGHFMSGVVNTTVELVVVELCDYAFSREHDADTGYKELVVHQQ